MNILPLLANHLWARISILYWALQVSMDHASRGAGALEAGHPVEALTAYTKALMEHPNSPDYRIQRSVAFTRLTPPRHDLALGDAEKGVLYGYERSKRTSIQAAQQRRVVSLYNLGRYADAKHILEIMRPWLGEEDKKGKMQMDMWMGKIGSKLKTLTEDQAVTVEEKPKIKPPSAQEEIKLLKRQIKTDGSYNFDWESEEAPAASVTTVADTVTAQPAASTSTSSAATSTSLRKVRHEWYQNAQSVTITLYARLVNKVEVDVDIQDYSLAVSFPHPSDPTNTFTFALDPLFDVVVSSTSTYKVSSSKVEITLKKCTPGRKWLALEGTYAPRDSTNGTDAHAKAAVMSTLQPAPATAPSYPTSSKSGPKNWDKLADEFTKKKENKPKDDKNKDKSAVSDDDEDMKVDSDEEGGDAVDSFFKKLYKGSDDDTRRAMMKSFQESNGTALSTNWGEVGQKRVEVVEESKDD